MAKEKQVYEKVFEKPDKIKWIYVTSANKKPMHLLDPYYNLSDVPGIDVDKVKRELRLDPFKERFPIDIDLKMIADGTPAQVPSDPFVQGMIKEEILVEVDAPRKTRSKS